jgi:hypothetical protein
MSLQTLVVKYNTIGGKIHHTISGKIHAHFTPSPEFDILGAWTN